MSVGMSKESLAEFCLNVGRKLKSAGRFKEAMEAFAACIAVDPSNASARVEVGELRLLHGDYAAAGTMLRKDLPTAGDMRGRRVLMYWDWDCDGRGDKLQFVRYAGLIEAAGGHPVIGLSVLQPELRPLFELNYGRDRVVDSWWGPPVHGAEPCNTIPCVRTTMPGQQLYLNYRGSLCDLHIATGAMLRIFVTSTERIPATVPYLRADPSDVKRWRRRMPWCGKRVGLVWSASEGAVGRSRSMPLSGFAPLATLKGVRFISLQKGPASAQARPNGLQLLDWTAELHDFAETAALIENLDLVISVDTAVAHLAGAMGKPVWVLLPYAVDWRWMLNRSDSPWYPTMRLFRQTALDRWDEPVRAVADELSRGGRSVR